MTERLVVDPITRIEGHLRIETQLQDGVICEAYASGTQFRGLELILRKRDPRDAWVFAQRICGVCTLVHGVASVRAVEDALGIEVPRNAQLVRNLMIAAQFIHDHVMHFYHLHALDWVENPARPLELLRTVHSFDPCIACAVHLIDGHRRPLGSARVL